MWRDAALVAGRDLRIERRSRVATYQVAPFAVLVLILFAFALDPDQGLLEEATSGLYWTAVLLAGLLALGRSASLDEADGVRDALRVSGLEPAGMFLGKAGSVAAQLVVLQALLAVGVVVLYDVALRSLPLLAVTSLLTTAAIATAGTLYGAVVSGLRARETLLPLLLLPTLAPVLIAATRAFEAALAATPAEGWPWSGLLAAFAIVYAVAGALAYGALLEGS